MATLGYDGFPVVSFCGHARLRGGGEEAARAEVFGGKEAAPGLKAVGSNTRPVVSASRKQTYGRVR